MPESEASGSSAGFDRFRAIVLAEPDLLDRLRDAGDAAALAILAVEIGRERGCEFHETDVRAALAAARRTWAERRSL